MYFLGDFLLVTDAYNLQGPQHIKREVREIMKKLDQHKFICHSCSKNNRVFRHRINAIDIDTIGSPLEVIPEETIHPIKNRYFYKVAEDIALTNGATLTANLFSDDNGNPLT